MELPIIYKNRYGELILEPLGDIISIKDVVGNKIIADGYSYSTDDAATIALITDNKGIQQSYNMENRVFYCLLHYTPSTVRVAKITIVKSNVKDPHAEIENCRRFERNLI